MIIWLASYPRSGNTFLRLILNHAYGYPTYSVYDDPLFASLGLAAELGQQPVPSDLATLDSQNEPVFVKTHNLPVDNRPAIYIVRDGRDALVSSTHYQRRFGSRERIHRTIDYVMWSGARWSPPPGVDSFKQYSFMRSLRKIILDTRFGGWSRNVSSWLNHERALAVVKFEDLVKDPMGTTQSALAKLEVDQTPQNADAVPDFESLRARWPGVFRKGKTGGWKEEMTPPMQELFQQHHSEGMKEAGYW